MYHIKLCLLTPDLSSEERVRNVDCDRFTLEDRDTIVSFPLHVSSAICWESVWFGELAWEYTTVCC